MFKFFTLYFLVQFVVSVVCLSVTPACPDGTVQSQHDSELCYKFVNSTASFEEADRGCDTFNGQLTEINDAFTAAFFSYTAYKYFAPYTTFWIGGKLINVQNYSIWTWSGLNVDKYLTYFDWSQPDAGTDDQGNCISVNTNTGTWTPQNCSVKLPYVCQIPPVISVCDSEWTLFEGTKKCYKVFVQKATTQAAAEKNCQFQGGHLVSIHNDDENGFIGQMTSTLTFGVWSAFGVWTGLHTNANGVWSWTDNSTTNFFNWGSEEPHSSVSVCSIYYADGATVVGNTVQSRTWSSAGCDDQLNRYICEKNSVRVSGYWS